jgi:ubiquinone/menaquinone biosynthesis C-methylase UbiE
MLRFSQEGTAEALPYPDAFFDAVVSQFGLMFFIPATAGLRLFLSTR